MTEDIKNLEEFINNTLANIKSGVDNRFAIDGPIEFELAVVKIKEGDGKFRIYVVEAGAKYNKEEVSKIKFKIKEKHNAQIFYPRQNNNKNFR